MTWFFILAASLVLLCLAWLLAGLYIADKTETDQELVNVSLARERRETLDSAFAAGAIDQTTYDYETEQLAFDLAADLQAKKDLKTVRKGHIPAAVLIAIFVPVTAGALYLHLGSPAAITMDRSASQPSADPSAAPALDDLLPELEQRLATSPDDVDGWRLLGRSYLSVGEFRKARRALEKALALDENHVPTLAQLAESIAMDQGGDLSGEPIPYLQRAQALDPTDEHSLWLLSIAQQQAGDHESALAGFDKLSIGAQQNPEALETIQQVRRGSLEALGLPLNTSPSELTDADPDGSSISITVSVSELTLKQVNSSDVVFIYAKAMNGPPMPLAVNRLKVAELPATVVLDDSMGMIPGMNLAAFPVVMVGARISATGDAMAQSGDWYKELPDIEVGEDASVELVIDQQMP